MKAICALSEDDILVDGDEGAVEIYAIEHEVIACVTTQIARAFVDINRAPDDRRPDGVVKTETIYRVPVYTEPLTEPCVEQLLARYHRPYHDALSEPRSGVILGLDCHTMAATAPPIADNPGAERPRICLSDGDGACPAAWFDLMADCLTEAFGFEVSQNDPFKGGYIVRRHASELPWMQLELSRAPFMPLSEKRTRLITALHSWYARVNHSRTAF